MHHNNYKVKTKIDTIEQKNLTITQKQTRTRNRNQGNNQRKEKHNKTVQTI
jgi:hypothetical protein